MATAAARLRRSGLAPAPLAIEDRATIFTLPA
jgi:hypothetical protein